MKQKKIFKKPLLAFVAIIFVVGAIALIEYQKPGIKNNQSQKDDNSTYPLAPEFSGIENWINTKPLTMNELRGKVVLVDFWTYTCINCIRTLPYLKEWDKKYSDKGLVIVGVHTPEFAFEKKYENVLKAVSEYNIKYPIAQDNDYATWNAYQNRYWPHKFLIDADGRIRYDHIGEGGYDDTEKMIQKLLMERAQKLKIKDGISDELTKIENDGQIQPGDIGTPEIYLGYQFTRGNFGNPEGIQQDKTIDYSIPKTAVKANQVYLEGKWKGNADNMELVSDEGRIVLIFKAKKINVVAGSDLHSNISVSLDSKHLNETTKGDEVIIQNGKGIAKISEYKLYNLATAPNYDIHFVDLTVRGKGFKLYTFTFG
ncbi:MAG TPA: thioredoxin family protein [Candidatus Nanoarchaeia archaeon]|nr:thioredoxin family protein [Candidatus Nanoarchaeia archaeon]